VDVRWKLHEVWGWNFESEFNALKAAVAQGNPSGVILALDFEFPGFIAQEPRSANPTERYQALCENVDRLRPIQLGVAVGGSDGSLRGVWNFNLKFDTAVDLHTEKAVSFLRAAGIDFPRHAKEGIEAAALGRRLAGSILVGHQPISPWWLTFSGSYDLGYLLKLLTGSPLPQNAEAFDLAVASFCPRRHELREQLPFGSLDNLARRYSVRRHGKAHTAGSDALLTLDLFIRVSPLAAQGENASDDGSVCSPQQRRSWNSYYDDAWGAGYSGWPPYTEAWYDRRWDAAWGGLGALADGATWPSIRQAMDQRTWIYRMQAAVAPQLCMTPNAGFAGASTTPWGHSVPGVPSSWDCRKLGMGWHSLGASKVLTAV